VVVMVMSGSYVSECPWRAPRYDSKVGTGVVTRHHPTM